MTTKLTAIILFLAVSSFAAFSQTPKTQGGAVWQVDKYDLDVTLPQTFDGRDADIKAVLDIKNVSSSPQSTLTLRLSPNAKVSQVSVNGAAQDFSGGEEKLTGNRTLQRVILKLATVRPDSTVKVAVTYKLNVKDNGDAIVLSPAASHFLPLAFWYPTPTNWFYSKGADHAPFSLRVKPFGSKQVVSSGEAAAADGSFTIRTPAQPFFAVGDWTVVNSGDVAVYVPKASGDEAQKRAGELAKVYSEARAFTQKFLGAGPTVPLRIVAVRRGAGFSDAGVAFIDEALFRRPKLDAATVQNLAEAAAKITLASKARDDGYGMISEGLSRYLANRFIAEKYGEQVESAVRARQRAAFYATTKREVPLGIVSPLDEMFFGLVANKGAMFWGLAARLVGDAAFTEAIKNSLEDGTFTLEDIRTNFPTQKDLVAYFIEKATETNLLAGLPQATAGGTKVALRNAGPIDVTVNVRATGASGKVYEAPVTLKASSFGEVTFQTTEKIVRTEIDTDKFYPQTEYYDDLAPKVFDESDAVAGIKSLLDQKKFDKAAAAAKDVLKEHPAYDDVAVQLARAYLSLGKFAEAEELANSILAAKLPTAKSMAWAAEIRAEAAANSGKKAEALKGIEQTILFDADYGASYAARKLRTSLSGTTTIDPSIKDLFAKFDAAAIAHKKADVFAMVMPGEITRFAENVAGSAAKWQTEVTQVDMLSPTECLVEAKLSLQLLTQTEQSGLAVFRLINVGGSWRIAAIEIFEVS